MTSSRDRFYSKLIVERGLLSQTDVDDAMARVAAAKASGAPGGSLVELLLRDGTLSPDDALSMRAEYDRKSRSTRIRTGSGTESGSPLPSDLKTGSSARQVAVQALAAESAHGNIRSPERDEVQAPRSPSQQIMAVFSDKPADAANATAVGTAKPRTTAPPDPLLGKTLGGCEILDRLGEGGMGTVYRARHLGLDKIVALKVLPLQMTDTETRIERFRREARSAAQIEHPNIVQIHNVGEDDGVHYIIMQYIQGEDLRHRLRRLGTLGPSELVEMAIQVSKGLAIAHEKGIVHRDIKPDNIMYDEADNVKLTDFGLAKNNDTDTTTTRPGKAVGTPYYMSPEQCAGKECDARSDIYSLGATMYHVLTGRRPFRGDTPVQTALMHLRQPLTPPSEVRKDTPEPLDRLICRMMSKNPDERYQSCPELVVALEEVDRQRSSSSPMDMISELVANLPPAGSASGVHAAHATGRAAAVPPAEDMTEPALPSVARSNNPGVAIDEVDTRPGMAVAHRDDDNAATSESLEVSGEQSGGDADAADPDAASQEMPHWSVLAIGAVVLLAIGAVVGLIVTNGDRGETPDPANNNTVVNDGGTNQKNGTGNGGSNGNATEDLAELEWRIKETEARKRLTAEDYRGAVVPVREFLDGKYGSSSRATDANALLGEIRLATRASCRKMLTAILARSQEKQQTPGCPQFQAALEELTQGDPVTLQLRAQLFPGDADLQQMVDTLQARVTALIDSATQFADRQIAYAERELAKDPPHYFDAMDILQSACGMGGPEAMRPRIDSPVMDLVRKFETRIGEIRKIVGAGQAARNAAVAKIVELQTSLAREFQDVLRDVDAKADSPAELDAVRQRIQKEWLDNPQRLPIRHEVIRVVADIDAVRDYYEELARKLGLRANQQILLAGDSAVTNVRIRRVTREGIELLDSLPNRLDPDRLEWRDLDPVWCTRLVARSEPQQEPLWLLANSRSTVARTALETMVEEKPSYWPRFGGKSQFEMRRESLTSVYRASLDGFTALGIAMTGGPAEGLIDRARHRDPYCGPAVLAAVLMRLMRARSSPETMRPATTRAALEFGASVIRDWLEAGMQNFRGDRDQPGWPYSRDPLFVVVACECALFDALQISDTDLPARSKILAPYFEAANKTIDTLGDSINRLDNEDVEPDDWRLLGMRQLRSRLRWFRARYRVAVAPTATQMMELDLKDALRDDPTAEEIWRALRDIGRN